MKQFLLVLCGIPATGKTILANEIKNQLDLDSQVEIVSTDEWRDDFYYNSFTPEKEIEVRQAALKKSDFLLRIGKSVIHDDTNYYTSMRHELYDLARINECVFGVVHITTPLEIALEWNLRRDTIIPEHVIKRISERLDEPGSKYTWDKSIFSVDLTVVGTSQAALEILHVLKTLEPVSIRTPDLGETLQELRDKVTRQIMGRFLRENQLYKEDPTVHRIRKSVLRDAKKNNWSVIQTKEQLEWELGKLTRRVS